MKVICFGAGFSMMLVQASERRSSAGNPRRVNRENLVQALQDAGGEAGRIAFEALRKIADQFLDLVGIVQFPGLAQHPPNRGVQRLR